MRWIALAAGWLGAVAAVAAANAEDAFPQTLRIGPAGARVYSGPDREYYATDRLPADAEVEVYRREPNGMLAIRPPEGSFSWVRGAALRITDGGLAESVEEGAMAFVGSRVRANRDVVQVRLRRGELVEVLGSETLVSHPTEEVEIWYRIAPPAGEFRWIDSRDLADSGVGPANRDLVGTGLRREVAAGREAPARATMAAAQAPLAGEAAGRVAPASAIAEETPAGALAEEQEPGLLGSRVLPAVALEPESAAVNPAEPPPRRAPAMETFDLPALTPPATGGGWRPLPPGTIRRQAPAGGAAENPTPPAAGAAAPHGASAGWGGAAEGAAGGSTIGGVASGGAAWSLGGSAHPAGPGNAAGSAEETLRQLDLEFSRLMAQPHDPALFAALLTRTQQLADSAASPLEQGRARLLYERLVEYGEVQQRRAELAAMAGAAAGRVTPIGPYGAAAQPAGIAPPDAAAGQAAAGGAGGAGAQAAAHAAPLSAAGPPAGPASRPAPEAINSPSPLERLASRLLYPLDSGEGGPAPGAMPNFDGVGWLMPVVSRRESLFNRNEYIPPYALVDREGQVIQFVSPAPGMNLRRYERKEVGIFGQLTSQPHLNKPHLTAHRVVLRERHQW